MGSPKVGDNVVFDRDQLQGLIDTLGRRGYQVVGPVARDGAIVYDEISSMKDLPSGWGDEQDGGKYRLTRRDDALFGYAVGPYSWKKFLLPPVTKLLGASPNGEGYVTQDGGDAVRYAFLGVRACELAAIAVQDRVFLEGPFVDPVYKARREAALLIAVNCSNPSGTCFCVSMGTGPKAEAGFDLALTEIAVRGKPAFLAEVGSTRGGDLLGKIKLREASADDKRAAVAVSQKAAGHMGRKLDTAGLKDAMLASYESPEWEEIAGRCMTCGNCTLVCPTCFCTTIEDANDLEGGASRTRKLDSCFTLEFSYIHGANVRASGSSRYRQWAMHKLATWWGQFGTSGCVGCGRCITWCPVGIDITETAKAVPATAKSGNGSAAKTAAKQPAAAKRGKGVTP